MPSPGTYGPHSLELIHLTLASIWYSVENFFLGLGRGIGSSALHPVTGWFRGYYDSYLPSYLPLPRPRKKFSTLHQIEARVRWISFRLWGP